MSELPGLPSWLAALGPIIASVAACLVAWIRYLDRRDHRRMTAAACTACKDRLAGREPPEVAGLGVLGLLALAGAAWVLGSGGPEQLAHLLQPRDEIWVEARSGPVRRSCKGHYDCPPGQICERGQCVATARRPLSFELELDGAVCADRLLPRWQDRLPEVFSGRPPAMETVTPWLR